jgi:8-amino-7-oxononanoate synthase
MLDFTSALYLGMRHQSDALRPWPQLTTGRPAALSPPPRSREVAERLAALQACEHVTLAPSTLHLFWDLFGILAKERVVIYLDSGAYPIARWGVERAAARGVPVRPFPHHDVEALRLSLQRGGCYGLHPVVVADGFCPSCGQAAPIASYLESIHGLGGRLILDDTQALGIFGHSPGLGAPYGWEGGGSLRWNNVTSPQVLVVSSLAKAFGVPLAMLAGSEAMVRTFEAKSETRVHCSPPSVALLHTAEHALAINQEHGDALRLRLAQLVRCFRELLRKAGFAAAGEVFPVQTLKPIPGLQAARLHECLLRRGIRTVLHGSRSGHDASISFLLTARHDPRDLNQAVNALGQIRTGRIASSVKANRRIRYEKPLYL